MTINTKTAEPMGLARQHPRYSALCTLPGGEIITAAAAKERGFVIGEKSLAPEPPKAPPRPLPAPVAAVPPRPVVVPVPAAVVADRARVTALIAMTGKGAEAEAECREAIRSGASVEEYQTTVAARSILDAIGAPCR